MYMKCIVTKDIFFQVFHHSFSNMQLCKAPTLERLLHESESDEKSLASHDSSGGSVLRDCPFTGTNGRLLFSSPPEEKENDESHFSAAECEHYLLFPPVCGHDKDHNFDRHGGSSDNPDLSEALSTNHSPAADLHTGQEPTEDKSEQNVDLGEVEGSLRPFSELLQEGGGKNDASLLPVTLLVPSLSESKENDGASVPPLEVTTSSALNAAPWTEYLEKCLINRHSGQQVSHPNCLRGLSHQPAIRDDLETTTTASGGSEGKDRHIFGSSEGAYDVGSIFQHSPSNTIAKTPNIICYPPLNGDELERNGLESWLGHGFTISKGISHSLVMPDFLVDGKCEPRLCGAESKDDPPLPSVINYNRDHNAELWQSLTSPPSPTVQRDPALAQSDKAKPPCINLQALLKRSQEYRQQQQMLRSKGKNREVQEKSPEPTRARTDHTSLSGKKSNEFSRKRTETANEGKPKEKLPGEETKEFWEKCRTTESQLLCNLTNSKSENTHVQEDGCAKEIKEIQEETTIKSDTVNISQEVTMKPKQTSSSPQQHYKGSRKYNMTRAATFSQSPVYRKSGNTKSSRQFEESGLGNDAGDNGFDEKQQVNEETIDHQAGSTPDLFTVDATIAGALPNHPATSSNHNIDLIESNLCGLKAQILDLESTLKDRLEGHSPNESDMNLELEYEKGTQNVTNSDTKCLRRQLLKEMINAEENPGPEPSDGHDDLLVIGRTGPQVINSDKRRLVKTLNTEGAMQKAYEENPLTGKGAPHEAQQDQISGVFQNVSSETEVSSGFLVLSHTADHSGQNEATGGCRCGQPRGHPSLENHFTPESGDEFQGRGSGLGLSPALKTSIFMRQGCQKCGQVFEKQCKYEVNCN